MSDITTSTALIHPDSEREDESTGDHHQDKKNSQFDQFENIGETGVSSPRHTFKSVMVLTQFDPFGNISETGVFSPRTFKSVMVLISDPTIILNGIRSVISNNANADDLRDDIASLLIPEIKSDQAFMIVFPEFFREFFLEAKNTYGPDKKFGYRYKSGVKKAPAGIPISHKSLSKLVKRTTRIIGEFRKNPDSVSFTPDAESIESSRSLLKKCFDLCDGTPSEIEAVRFDILKLDELLAEPVKALPPPTVTHDVPGNTIVSASAATTDVVLPGSEFVNWRPKFKDASEWKILKTLRDLPSGSISKALTPNHVEEIVGSLAVLYADKIDGFVKDSFDSLGRLLERSRHPDEIRTTITRWKEFQNSRYRPISFLSNPYQRYTSGSNFSAPKKGGYDGPLLMNYLFELIEKAQGNDSIKYESPTIETLHRSILSELGLFHPSKLVWYAFLGREWAKAAIEEIGVDLEEIPSVINARMRIDKERTASTVRSNASNFLEFARSHAGANDFIDRMREFSLFEILSRKEDEERILSECDGFGEVRIGKLLATRFCMDNGLMEKSIFSGGQAPEHVSNFGHYYSELFWRCDKTFEAVLLHAKKSVDADTFLKKTDKHIFLSFLAYDKDSDAVREKYGKAIISEFVQKSPIEALKLAPLLVSWNRNTAEAIEGIPFDEIPDKIAYAKTILEIYTEWSRISHFSTVLFENFKQCFFLTPEGVATKNLIDSGRLVLSEDDIKSIMKEFDYSLRYGD